MRREVVEDRGHATELLVEFAALHRVPITHQDRQQVGHQRNGLTEVIGALSEHRFQLGQPLLGGILTTKTRGPFELRDVRIERAILMVG